MSGAGRDGPIVLCRLEEIEDGQARGFTLGEGIDATDLFVVRRGEQIFGYLNSCPHAGTPLDWVPDRFFDAEGKHLMCHTHGALFRIEDGFCLAGPCAGDRLTPLELGVDGDGRIVLAGPPRAR